MKVINEIGLKKIIYYFFYKILILIYKLLYFSPLQIIFLRLLGSQIGKNVILENVMFYNLYVNGFKNLIIGNNVYIGEGTLIDLANKVIIKNNVTLAARINISTHLNVGYSDNILKKTFHRQDGKVIINNNVFIGLNSVILNNVEIGENCFIGACSLINKNINSNSVCYGIPAKKIRELK